MLHFRKREYTTREIMALGWVPVVITVLIALSFLLKSLAGL